MDRTAFPVNLELRNGTAVQRKISAVPHEHKLEDLLKLRYTFSITERACYRDFVHSVLLEEGKVRTFSTVTYFSEYVV